MKRRGRVLRRHWRRPPSWRIKPHHPSTQRAAMRIAWTAACIRNSPTSCGANSSARAACARLYHVTIQPQLAMGTTCMHVSHQALAARSYIVQLLAGQRRRFHFSIFLLSCECVYVCNTSFPHVCSTTRTGRYGLCFQCACSQYECIVCSTAQANMVYASNVQTLPCDQWVASGSGVLRQGKLADRIAISAASAVLCICDV